MNITVPAVNSVEVSTASPSQVNVSTATSFSATVTNKGPKGDTGATGPQGDPGLQGDPGQGLAAGGTTSQLLVKSSGDDYDTSWTSDLSVNSATVTNNINNIGSLVNLGGITTIGNLSAGSISGVSTATINTGNISTLNTGQLYFSGSAAASIFHSDGLYDRLGVYSDGGILNVLDHNNDNIDDQFVIADHSLTPLMVVNSTGNVGIGTTSPSTLLTLDTSAANAIRINRSGTQRIMSDASGNNAGFSFNSNTNAKWQIGAVGNDFLIENSNYLGDPTGNKRIFIDSFGNVGIGTTTPAAKLDISDSNSNIAVFRTTNANADLYLRASGTGSDGKVGIRASDNNLRFISNGATQASFNGSNLGIGTTTPSAPLTVIGNSYLQGDVAVGPQATAGPISGYTLSVRDTAPSIYLKDQTGVVGDGRLHVDGNIFSIGVDPDNVTADAALRFETRGSERMRIDADGNVGIGTTTPESSLHIAGTSGITMGRNSVQNKTARVYADAGDNLILTAASGSGKVIKLNNYVFGNTIDWAFTNSTGNKLDFTFNPNGWGGNNAPSLASFNSTVGYSTGDWKMVKIENTLNQSGDAAFTDLFINRTENSVGTGNQYFIDAHNNGVSNFNVDSQGKAYAAGGLKTIGDSYGNTVFLGQKSTYFTIESSHVGDMMRFYPSVNRIQTIQPLAVGSSASPSSTDLMALKHWSSNASHNMIKSFATDGSDAFFLKTDGKVGIGTSTPSEKLDVAGKANINDGNNNVLISTGNSTITASNTTAVGYQALTALTTGAGNTAVGYQAGDSVLAGVDNTFLGYGTDLVNGNNSYNTLIGSGAYVSSNGNRMTAVGYSARAGGSSTSIGAQAGNNNSGESVAMGYQAGNGAGNWNTSIGNSAHTLSTGNYNTSIGGGANRFTSGDNNVAVGNAAAYGVQNTSTFSNTVAIGYQAGTSLTTGGSNVLIGYQAGSTLTTESNKLYIENSNSTTPLIYGEFDNDILRVNGTLQVGDPSSTGFALPAADGTANQVLSTDGSGAVTWVDQSGGGGATDAEIGFAYKTTDQTLTGTFTAISGFDGELFDDLTSFDTTTGALTITDVGHYLINIDVMSNVTSGIGRSGSEIYLEFNGSEVAGSRRGMYNRNNISGYTSASITFPYYHSTGTATFKVMAAQTSGTDTVIIDNCTFSYSTLGGTQGPQGVSGDAFDVGTEAAGRTLVAGDHLKYLRSTSATAVTFTVPPQSSVSWVDNAEIVFEQAGTGQITIAAGSGVTINSSETLKSGQQYAVIGLKRVASDTWTLTGERELL